MSLNKHEQKILLNIARRAIMGDEELSDVPPSLETKCGAFVSLYVSDALRGCLGTFSEEKSLADNVSEMARAAATSDNRFEAVKGEEMMQLRIEISVLSPRRLINDIREIRMGTHGIYIQKGAYRGTFLPQVARKQNWTVEEFLGHCAENKAGLGWSGWKDADIYTYEAQVITE